MRNECGACEVLLVPHSSFLVPGFYMPNTIDVKVKRQLTPDSAPFWEEFPLPYRPTVNLIAVLQEIAANPVTRDGKASVPITYDSTCLEEVCGARAMVVNGKSRQASTASIARLEHPVRLHPVRQSP